jgi:TetR/AcrR family transcriptional regulator, regulator of cefoperazone and chloramphenicol sensitivity
MPESQTKSTGADPPRDRLIQAGIRVFARYGFEGATTRQLAEAAGVNQAAIPYYYGGKEPLYHAVVAHIVQTVAPPRLAAAEKIRETLAQSDATRPVLAGLLETLLGSLVDLVGTPEAIDYGRIIIREQMAPTAAFDLVYDGMIQPVHTAASALVGRLIDAPADAPGTILRTHALLGQVFMFLAAREAILQRLKTPVLSPEALDEIRRLVVESIDRLGPPSAAETESGKGTP